MIACQFFERTSINFETTKNLAWCAMYFFFVLTAPFFKRLSKTTLLGYDFFARVDSLYPENFSAVATTLQPRLGSKQNVVSVSKKTTFALRKMHDRLSTNPDCSTLPFVR